MRRYALREDQWDRIKDLLPGKPGDVGVTAKGNRLFVEAVLYRYRAGIPWRDLPEGFGNFKAIHTRFTRWSQKGVWKRVFEALTKEEDNEYAMIDGTIVRAHQHSAGSKKRQNQAIGRSAGDLSTKIHATCDGLGNPTGFHLTPGQNHDLEGADALMDHLTKADAVLADKAYDADERVREKLKKGVVRSWFRPKRIGLFQLIMIKIFIKRATLLKISLLNSSNTAPLQHAMIKHRRIFSAQFTWLQLSFGSIEDGP